jgi:KUP system potassium uptake protein
MKGGAASASREPSDPQRGGLPWSALSALGIVFGDLGTSPLYTLQTVVHAMGGRFTAESAVGILSLIVWTLIVTISVKYCLFVMRADNHGEGGILALMSLVGANSVRGRARIWTAMGLLGAALIYGDGVITPSISVLSALEGVKVATPALTPYVLPSSVAVLAALFALQPFGTARIGGAFGPVMLIWFFVIALLGVAGIVRNPSVLAAIDPGHALRFLASHGVLSLFVLGGVFLCITGGEALYADMGHFGRNPIRLAWFAIALPALLLSYAGQTALLIEKGNVEGNPFFLLAPQWAIYPLVILAAIATIIASQAIITGSFSMTRQAMQLGWFPGVHIRQTSDEIYGQIYVPVVNVLMMFATVAIAVYFGSSDRLAGAYGMAVSLTMLLTSFLLVRAMRNVWHWSWASVVPLGALFLAVDGGFFAANSLKLLDGGWIPLVFGVAIFLVMTTWRSGVDAVRARLSDRTEDSVAFLLRLEKKEFPRVPGTAIFLTHTEGDIPNLVVDHVKYTGALHQTVVCLHVAFDEVPRTAAEERARVKRIADGIWHATVKFGFLEVPNVRLALSNIDELDPSIDLGEAIYFAARDLVVRSQTHPRLARWRLPLFRFLFRNAVKAVDRFHLPPLRSVELARQIEI